MVLFGGWDLDRIYTVMRLEDVTMAWSVWLLFLIRRDGLSLRQEQRSHFGIQMSRTMARKTATKIPGKRKSQRKGGRSQRGRKSQMEPNLHFLQILDNRLHLDLYVVLMLD